MTEKPRNAIRGRPLNAADDRLGVSFGPDGPAIGPVPLLERRDGVLTPRLREDLAYVLDLAFDTSVRIERFMPALAGVAKALNGGDEGQAMLRVQLMGLPGLPDEDALQRAMEAEDMIKAGFDPERHPRYPKLDPNGWGGRFRALGDAAVEAAEALTEAELKLIRNRRVFGSVARQAVRAGLRRMITERAERQLAGVAATNIIPAVGEVADALEIEQLAETAPELSAIPGEVEAAVDFVNKGPWNLEDLYVSKVPRSFKSFNALKKLSVFGPEEFEKFFGAARPGYEYHHLVEQAAGEGAFTPEELNSTDNIVQIPKLLHQEITSEYASMATRNGVRMSLRAALRGTSFKEQRMVAIALLYRLGIISEISQ